MTPAQLINRLDERGLLEEIEAVCTRYHVTVDDVLGHCRARSIVVARHECWRALRDHPERFFSLPELGTLFDRDHTTVMAGVRAARRRRLRIEVAA